MAGSVCRLAWLVKHATERDGEFQFTPGAETDGECMLPVAGDGLTLDGHAAVDARVSLCARSYWRGNARIYYRPLSFTFLFTPRCNPTP